MENNTVIARSLGVIQLRERHRGPYIASVVEELLKSFGVSLKQVHTITTDLAKNMFNTTRHLAMHAYDESAEHQSYSDDDSDDHTDGFASTNSSYDDRMELENELEIPSDLNNDERYVELLTDMTNNLQRRNNYLSLINHINCCAHGSQLAVNEAIAKSNTTELLNNVCEMMKGLRTTVINIEFRKIAPRCILPHIFNVSSMTPDGTGNMTW